MDRPTEEIAKRCCDCRHKQTEVTDGRRWSRLDVDLQEYTGSLKCSQVTTTPGAEIQHNGKFNNSGSSEWKHVTYDDTKTAERKTLRKRNKWSHWATHVKRLVKNAMEEIIESSERIELSNGVREDEGNCSALLGKYWKDAQPKHGIRVDGTENGVKMVISKQKDTINGNGQVISTVEVANMVDCTDMNHGADPGEALLGTFMEFGWDKIEDRKNMGICNTVETNNVTYTVTDKKIETLNRGELTQVSGELMRETVLNRELARSGGRRREIKASETNDNGYGKRGSVFGRICQRQVWWKKTQLSQGNAMKRSSRNSYQSVAKEMTKFGLTAQTQKR